ncbi:LamG domain-containing protein [Candidatus Microgenomates bacterium]|nr:MAG: LamG domain-containing protein [Candidatus Microgenomates bacterium]
MRLIRPIKKLKIRTLVALMLIVVMLPIIVFSIYHPSGTDAATWNFDEGYGNPADSSSSALPTTLSGALWKTNDLCLSGKCLYFDGADDYVSTTSTTVFDATATYTVMAWIRPTFGGEAATETFISKTGVVDFNISDTNDNVVVAYTGGTTASSNNSVLTANKWHHVAITYNGSGTIAIYIDGNDQTSDSSVTESNSAASTLFGSELTAASTQSYQGFMDMVKIYTSQLTAAQVKSEYSSVSASESGISASVGGGTDQSYLSNGLVGYWKMDETATPSLDSSGNALSGTWNGSTASTTGKYGNGTVYDGTGDFIDVGTSTTLQMGTGDFTISTWFKNSTDGGSNVELVSKNKANCGDYDLYLNSSENVVFAFRAPSSCVGPTVSSTASYTDGSWHHAVATVKRNEITRLFIDGQQVASETTNTLATTTANVNDAASFQIGARNYVSGPNYFTGTMDETRVYNRALSPAEVAGLYNFAPGPVGHWKMDEGSWNGTSNEVTDSSTYANHGTAAADATTTTGKFGNGGTFDGTGDYAQTGASTSMDISGTSALTMSYWVKISSLPGATVCPLSLTETGYADGTHDKNFEINSSGIVSFYVYDGSEERATATSALTTDTWHHITGQFVGANDLRLYIDGQLVNKNTTAGSTFDFTTPQLVFGGKLGGVCTTDFAGQVDDVRVYNYARTPGQIVSDMNASHPLGGSPIGSQVIYYKFDEMQGTVANDNVGNQNGTIDSNLTWSTPNECKYNGCLEWDAAGEEVTIATASDAPVDFGPGEAFSGSAWVYVTTMPGSGNQDAIIAKWDETGNLAAYKLYVENDDADTTGNFEVQIYDESASQALTASQANDSVAVNTWYYVAWTFNGGITGAAGDLKLYVDGRYVAQNTANGSFAGIEDLGSDFTIGEYDPGDAVANNTAFTGFIDEVKIYAAELTAANIQVDHNAGAALSVSNGQIEDGVGTPPVGWWKLDDNTGTAAVDSSGNDNNASLLTPGDTNNEGDWLPGKIGAGFNAELADHDVATVTDPASGVLDFGTGSFTLMGWVNPESNPFSGRPFTKGFFSTSSGYGFEINGSNGSWQFDGGDPDTSPSTNAFAIETINAILTGEWHHLAGVVDKSTNQVRVYIDGIAQTFNIVSGFCGSNQTTYLDISSCTINVSTGNNFDIGGIYDSGTPTTFQPFDGIIDDVKVYNYARSQAQIMYDYNRGRPIGYWKMDEASWTANCSTDSVFDSSGYNNHGDSCPNGTGQTTPVSAKYNTGVDFDGSDDYFTMGDVANFDFVDGQNFSISGWFNRDTFTTDDTLVAKKNDQGNTTAGFIAWIDDSTDDLRLVVSDGDSTNLHTVDSTSAFTATGWHHFVIVYDDSSSTASKIYIDGRDDSATNTVTGTFASIASLANAVAFTLGAESDAGNPFDGKVDEVQIYNYALSATQAQLLFNQGVPARFGPQTGSP